MFPIYTAEINLKPDYNRSTEFDLEKSIHFLKFTGTNPPMLLFANYLFDLSLKNLISKVMLI